VASNLQDGGVALLHSICRLGPPGVTNPWVRRHIFPGGYNPALSELMDGIEHSALKVTDVEVLRQHYALTLSAWQARFQRQRAAIAERMSERFCRMWEFYLAASEAAFATGSLAVAQVQLALDHQAVPLTRDYLYQTPIVQPLRRTG
jgi:cyclopropane-fatty-acyl-phospholipid synthase